MQPINIAQLEKLAKERLKPHIYDFFAGGSANELTLLRNQGVFGDIKLIPQVLSGTIKPDLSTKILDISLAFPLMCGPAAFQCLAHKEGEIAAAKAFHQANLAYIASTMSTISLEQIISNTQCQSWFQLYIYKDRGITLDLIKRAEKSGYAGIVVTVDVPIMGKRNRDIRNNFYLPPHLVAANITSEYLKILSIQENGSSIKAFTDAAFDPNITWKDIELIKTQTKLPLIIKGIMRSTDAIHAVNYGASAIIVSNHGGRQLDGVPSTMELLARIRPYIAESIPCLVDGGIRCGTDILKAIALGADCTLIARPVLWALALNGSKGVTDVLHLLQQELYEAMVLCGYSSIAEIKKDKDLIYWNYLNGIGAKFD